MTSYGLLLNNGYMSTPPESNVDIRRNVALIGGSKGLGAALKTTLTASGHNVFAIGRGPGLLSIDLSWHENKIRHNLKAASHALSNIDTLIVTAGMGSYDPPWVSYEKVDHLFRVNVLGPMAVFRAMQRKLLKTRGRAIFVTSTAARRPGSGGLAYYAATKGAMHSWIISEARRQIKHDVALCAVAPGFFDSPMTDRMAPSLRRATEKAIPAGRYGKDYEIASFISDLLWQSNWVLAGQIFEASGGA
jgi:3-oxoacyl-[acyl-carrier protein] reductase